MNTQQHSSQSGRAAVHRVCEQKLGRALMLVSSIPHHNTGGFKSHRKFLADKEYGEALDTLVKACSDMLLISPDGKTIFLGKRLVQPQPDWWFVGGRMFPGETPSQSCCRLLRRELGLDIDPTRMQPVCCQSLAWGMREQLCAARLTIACWPHMRDAPHPDGSRDSTVRRPKENGTTDSQFVLSLQCARPRILLTLMHVHLCSAPGITSRRLEESEVGKVVLDAKEYESSQWIEPQSVLDGDFHPALQFAVRSLLATRKLSELRQMVGLDDAEVAKVARELVALTANPPVGQSDYRVVAPALQYECAVETSI
jgi:hypothetical protein